MELQKIQKTEPAAAPGSNALVHCPSCKTRKPMIIKELIFRVGGDKIIYRCVACDAEVALPAQ